MIPEDATEYTHTCPNVVYLRRVDGRDLVHVLIAFKGALRDIIVVRLLPADFDEVDKLFPKCPWSLNNTYPAISACRRDGKRDRFMVGRVLEFLEQQAKWRAGKLNRKPSTKGVYVKYGAGGKYDLTPENRSQGDARADRRSSHYATGWTIEHRQALIERGKDPNEPEGVSRPLGPPKAARLSRLAAILFGREGRLAR